MADKNRLDPIAQKVLANLDMIGERKFHELKKTCNISDEDLESVLNDIRSLNPKPAADYDTPAATAVIPDVFVRRHPSGEYLVELNQMSLPRILINHEYRCRITRSKDTGKYLRRQLGQASFLIKALHQRAETILRVSEEIVRTQRDFFEYGIDHLKPMQLKDIAEKAEIHESTVSRAVANKYKIKELINQESPQAILSDDKLVELLAAQGIKIARRTIAKYRETMNIPTSAERKRQKRPPK